MRKKHLAVDIDKCTGCRMCELACGMEWEKTFYPAKSRIKVHLIGLPQIPVPVFTRKCDACGGDPVCVKYCEVDALTYSENNPKPDKKKITIPEALAEEWLKQAVDNIK